MRRGIIAVYILVTVMLAAITLTPDGGLSCSATLWFAALWLLLAAGLAVAVAATRMWRHAGRFTLHAALLLILAGGAASALTRESTLVTLTPGRTVAAADNPLHTPLRLDSFVTVSYPGNVAPRDYRSHITAGNGLRLTVAVNSPATLDGSTLRQHSCDSLGRSTIEIARDPWGIPLTYAGYALFIAGGIMLLADPRGRFRRLLRPGATAAVAIALLLPATARSAVRPGVSAVDAASMRRTQVLWKGRAATMNTAATLVCRKLSGTATPGGASPEQVVASMILYPGEWRTARLLKIDSRRLADSLKVEGRHASVADLFDPQGRYRLTSLYGIDPGLDKAVLSLDERLEIVDRLQRGQLIRPLPPGMAPMPAWKVELELTANRIPFAAVFFPAAFLLALGAPWMPRRAVMGCGVVIGVWQLAGWAIAGITEGTAQLDSGGGMMQFLSVAILGVTLAAVTRHRFLLAAGILAAAFAGLVAWLSLRNPVLTPMMPVLHSPWLSVHVSLVMMAYALLTLASAAALGGAASGRHVPAMHRVALLLLYPAVVLLGAGIFTGAVWAQTAWGRYWAWDPKETWALITMMTYAVALHRGAGRLGRPTRAACIFIASAWLTVIMTGLGTNMLPSLHAYQ